MTNPYCMQAMYRLAALYGLLFVGVLGGDAPDCPGFYYNAETTFDPAVAIKPFELISPECPYPYGDPISNYGDSTATLRFLEKAERGEATKVIFLGGSISACAGLGRKSPSCFANLMQLWFSSRYENVTVINNAVPATGSDFAAKCIHSLVDADADLVFVEYGFNDRRMQDIGARSDSFDIRRQYDRLIRKLLTQIDGRPAIVGLHMWDVKPWLPLTPWSYFAHSTVESEHEMVLKYYGIPSVSLRASVSQAYFGSCPCYLAQDLFMEDGHHLQLVGSHHTARALVYYLTKVNASYSAAPERSKRWLPPEPFDDNTIAETICHRGEAFRNFALPGKGWAWNDSDPQKSGYESCVGLSSLELPFVVTTTDKVSHITISLGYVRSYHHVREANVFCRGLCICGRTALQNYHRDNNTQTYFSNFELKIENAERNQPVTCALVIESSMTGRTEDSCVKVTSFATEEGTRTPGHPHTAFAEQGFGAKGYDVTPDN